MLTFQNVSFAYPAGGAVLNGTTFQLRPGSSTLLVGRNGSGKSTMVQLSNGLLIPGDGQVLVRGRSTSECGMHEIVRDVGVMFQHPGDQITERTVAREVAVGLEALGLDRPSKRVTAALQRVDLAHRADDHPYDLEPSQRKLVTLAATIAMQTGVVILDEPFVGLGPAEGRVVERVVAQLRNEGRSVLLVAHDILQAWPLSDRVLVLHGGTIVLDRALDGSVTPASVFEAATMPAPTSLRFASLLPSSRG